MIYPMVCQNINELVRLNLEIYLSKIYHDMERSQDDVRESKKAKE